jgi:hypothetical protein
MFGSCRRFGALVALFGGELLPPLYTVWDV